MARSDGSTQQILTVDELIRQVRAMAETINAKTGNTRWYLFGSALRDPARAADIDLLVVCQTDSAADAVRRIAEEFAFPSLDLSILTDEEEAECSFVTNQRCIQVFPSTHTG